MLPTGQERDHHSKQGPFVGSCRLKCPSIILLGGIVLYGEKMLYATRINTFGCIASLLT